MDQETKREKFVRLAEKRTNRILEQIGLLGNLSNTNAYEYSQKDIDTIFQAIDLSVKDAKRKFADASNSKPTKFTLE